MYLKQGTSGFEEVDAEEVRRRYGVEPALVPDFIALRGDPSDGLPGAPGIGPKKAAELLAKHHSLEQAIAGAQPQIESRNHHLETSLSEGALLLEGDPARLEQIFLNLLTNAAKYTDPGGNIWLTVERRESQWLVRIRDNGKGLPPEILPHVFDLFTQAEAGSQGGLGIGLNLVRGLVEMHGGSVEALSAGLGQGSEFVVRLPTGVRVSVPSLRE